ncbi:ribosome-inactivating protein [Tanacetum coccineum]
MISSVASLISQTALALMLYKGNQPKGIRMPVPGADEQCPNAQCNQTFKSDGTIRSNGKCLTTNGYASGQYIMIYDCDTAKPDANKWILYNAGSIMNPTSGLVIAAKTSTQATANGANTRVWLANYVIGTEPRQQWPLYGDGTIRLYSDCTLYVTSDGHQSLDIIILLKCQGWGDQRWTFMADGTILNPNARLVMDVRRSDVVGILMHMTSIACMHLSAYLFAAIDSDWHMDSLKN